MNLQQLAKHYKSLLPLGRAYADAWLRNCGVSAPIRKMLSKGTK